MNKTRFLCTNCIKIDSKIPFFNLGPKNKWKTILNDDLKNKLNEVFKKKLEELDYELT